MALYLKRICYNLDSELNKFEVDELINSYFYPTRLSNY